MKNKKELLIRTSKLTEEQQSKLFEFYTKGDIDLRIFVHSLHREILNKIYAGEDKGMMNKLLSLDLMSYVSLLLAIKIVYLKRNILTQESLSPLCVDEIINLEFNPM